MTLLYNKRVQLSKIPRYPFEGDSYGSRAGDHPGGIAFGALSPLCRLIMDAHEGVAARSEPRVAAVTLDPTEARQGRFFGLPTQAGDDSYTALEVAVAKAKRRGYTHIAAVALWGLPEIAHFGANDINHLQQMATHNTFVVAADADLRKGTIYQHGDLAAHHTLGSEDIPGALSFTVADTQPDGSHHNALLFGIGSQLAQIYPDHPSARRFRQIV